ncbi:hypothetical protein GGTG_05042 [Gaeumannomyces tritici R3-111a-1]|uniref:Uncharacterized protein n=1 Tax=Gaeumannomyces tritici (strain R3-111a-1) TaxID=644352 RepID=J3NUT6_GAET3|nr:hypothetical protein GGTG_05042 [Gaeumannomyces tritici R3-111a-1]EJT79960.1 hypothetical protein GGTG_05042 [Gaeumannomyces tritici R3-111a-1]
MHRILQRKLSLRGHWGSEADVGLDVMLLLLDANVGEAKADGCRGGRGVGCRVRAGAPKLNVISVLVNGRARGKRGVWGVRGVIGVGAKAGAEAGGCWRTMIWPSSPYGGDPATTPAAFAWRTFLTRGR